MRDEDPDGVFATFNLNDMGAALAADGLVLQHSVTEGVPLVSNATVRVSPGRRFGYERHRRHPCRKRAQHRTQFNYTLNFDGQANGAGAVENVTIVDADTEDNNVF